MRKKQNNSIILYIIALVILLVIAFNPVHAQVRVKQDAQGNFIQIRDTTNSKQDIKGIPTGKKYTDSKGISYDVYQSSRGSLFIIRVSKNGRQYKQYLKQ